MSQTFNLILLFRKLHEEQINAVNVKNIVTVHGVMKMLRTTMKIKRICSTYRVLSFAIALFNNPMYYCCSKKKTSIFLSRNKKKAIYY